MGCTKKQKDPFPTYQNPRPVSTNDFFVSLKDLLMENAEKGSEGISTKTLGRNENTGKGRPFPVLLTSEANFISC
jgi:hypothetical protein